MKNKGFTLIEMIGVIALVAILFLLSYTTILNSLKKGQDKVDEGTFNLLKSATKDYLEDNENEYPEVNKNVFCIDVNTLIDNNYIDEDSITTKNNSVLAKTVKVSYQDNKYNYELVDQCKERKKTGISSAVQYLLEDANPKSVTSYVSGSDESHQMYTFDHPATEQTPALTDYRYIGNDPYNYVEFNGETWRIIGVFTVEDANGNTSQRIKLIRNESIGIMAWDSNELNEWTTATLNTYLNGDYYNRLSADAREMVSRAKTYLGGLKIGFDYENVEECYISERGVGRYPESRSINDIKIISLMYPSDYFYTYGKGVDNVCYAMSDCANKGIPKNGWLYNDNGQWTVTPGYGELSSYVAFIFRYGNYLYEYSWSTSDKTSTRPVVYLKPGVKIVSGDGTKDNPYKLSI